MKCPRCGDAIRDTATKCPTCGATIEAPPPAPIDQAVAAEPPIQRAIPVPAPHGLPPGAYGGHQTTQKWQPGTAERMLIPVGRTALSIVAGYLGLISLFCWPCGLFALITGIMAARQIKRTPDAHGLGRAYFAIIAGSLGLVACVVFALNPFG